MSMKNLSRIWIGIKIGIMIPVLPENVSKIHNHPITRIFRVLGGISILLILSKYEFAKIYLSYIVFPLATLYFIQIININLVKFFFIISLWKKNKFQVRDFSVDKLASFSATLVACVKGTCVLGLSIGAALGYFLSIDELLLSYGREPMFKDSIGKGLDIFLKGVGLKKP